MEKKIDAFELTIISGLNNKEAGFDDDLVYMRDAFNNVVFSSLYCIQYLYLALMRKYQIQAPLYVRFINFKDFNPEEEYFEEGDPFFEVDEDNIEYYKKQLLKKPLTISPSIEYLSNKEKVGKWIDKLYKDTVSFFEHPTNGLEALYQGLTSKFKKNSHKVFVLVSDNDAKPLGGPYPIFKPKNCPEDEDDLNDAWEKLSKDSTIVFFSEEGSIYEELSEEWDNAYFYPIDILFDFSRELVTETIDELCE